MLYVLINNIPQKVCYFLKKESHNHMYNMKITLKCHLDYFVGFGMCLGKDEAELGKVWNEVLGRYDTAILNLVTDMLRESENPEEKLSNALSEMRTPESASRASKAIHKGKLETELPSALLW